MDEEDEEEIGGIYEGGHWIWDELSQGLVFVSDLPLVESEIVITTKVPTGTIEFRDDVELVDQARFRRKYQRKLLPNQKHVVTLQDVKDIALFTAPVHIQSILVINMLHTETSDRFLRALLLYIQYYIQCADIMAARMKELEVKLRTTQCEERERVFMDNLTELRCLVAREYSVFLMGCADMRKYHHMGPAKKRRSLTDLDARVMETFLRIAIQIVWLALGKISFNRIELEVHRMFKSETFNIVEHTLRTNYIAMMSEPERRTLLGRCDQADSKLGSRSPIMKDVFCQSLDYRLVTIGVIEREDTNKRTEFLKQALLAPEEMFCDYGFTLGILGLDRARFDTMLNEIKMPSKDDKSRISSVGSGLPSSKSVSRSSGGVSKKSAASERLFSTVEIPAALPLMSIPEETAPEEVVQPVAPLFTAAERRSVVETQRQRWLARFVKLVSGRGRAASTARSHIIM